MTQQSKIALLLKISQYLAANKKRVAYVSGKVTGLPVDVYTAKFSATRWKLIEDGFMVLNPIDFVPAGATWEDAMLISMILLCNADMIYMQSDWEDSKGAKMEWSLAVTLGLNVVFE